MTTPTVTLLGVAVQDPMTRLGWYVLGRRNGGRWLVVGSRTAYEHIMSTWANSAGKWDERLLVRVNPWGAPEVVRRAIH